MEQPQRSGSHAGTGRGPHGGPELAGLRRQYATSGLDVADLAADPASQLARWLADVVAAGLPEPNAMIVATTGADGAPAARYVLLKGLDARGLVFYTNYESAKGHELASNPRAAVLFPWHALERQVRITGPVERVSDAESDAYWAARPYGSRLGAWASTQSAPAESRAALDAAYAEMAARWPEAAADPATAGDAVPRPEFWGGYRVRIETAEFWQGRRNRLHDRLRYVRAGTTDGWRIERLWP